MIWIVFRRSYRDYPFAASEVAILPRICPFPARADMLTIMPAFERQDRPVSARRRAAAGVCPLQSAARAFTIGSKAYRQRGAKALASKPRGRPKQSRLAGWQAATVVNLVTDRCPGQLRLPFALWTREAVGQLMAKRFDMHVSVWTVACGKLASALIRPRGRCV